MQNNLKLVMNEIKLIDLIEKKFWKIMKKYLN